MPLSFENIAALALEMQHGLASHDRFNRMIGIIHRLFLCDATALLRYELQSFRPLAIAGLAPDVMGRRFRIDAHPRFEAIARAGDVVRFPAESDLPDPYDGLIPESPALHVHACIGLPLFYGQTLMGALTLDAIAADQFSGYSDDELRFVASLAATALNNALLLEQLEKSATPYIPSPRSHDSNIAEEMIGESSVMQILRKEIAVVAPSDLNVLITGNTGTGKELVAQSLHQQSQRASKPMIYLNCAALPESVAESELFGHVKGAFTGAVKDRAGKFELADGGTLFLDEIGELPLTLQAKLLRVLQYGDLQRVGEDRQLKVDVRIIAATNVDLKQSVINGSFRSDLYHRLSVFPLHVPTLQERGADIVLLAGFFCERCRAKFGIKHLSVSKAARDLLLAYDWPGNARELEHAIYRAAMMAQAEAVNDDVSLQPQHFSLSGSEAPAHIMAVNHDTPMQSLKDAQLQFQRDYILRAYNASDRKWALCARILEIDPGNLHRLAKKLGIK
ncbi:nitric oxide reductase transcriptional regulator NorR [Pantoea rwandensis]|uniref:Nitric oxide reductase transcription regulator n=1 Tax=Pantoea rwandensis TaxID=1076550 RepID=A0A1X1CX15_9GAMM|nr:nitric oxide reductase transcriptional regulator NorR [Pantoea rwandensis]ORM68880.1 nitric oxide reductase transcription regulator [Pantoea rwandensis]